MGMQMISQTAKTNPEKVAWIGGLEGKTLDQEQCKKLKAHIEKLAGEGCKFVNISSKGAGGAIFGSGEQAQQAIAAVNGTKSWAKLWKLTSGPRRRSSDMQVHSVNDAVISRRRHLSQK